MRSLLVGCAVLLLGAVLAPAAHGRDCGRIANPYPDTRYEGAAISQITATGVPCATARRVARRAHRRALGLTPPASGIRTFRYDGYRVRGDLRPSRDRYVATKGGRVVRWRF